jgi:dolichyl-phosphate-mannose-protein mannosyltransferase
MHLDKRDLLTIALLSVVFFSLAFWNLGFTQTPVTTQKFTAEDSFYLDLGSANNVGSIHFLLKDGSYAVTVYTGTPGDWKFVSTSNFSDYYKWNSVGIQQNVQFIKVNFNDSSNAVVAEVAVSDSSHNQLNIQTVVGLGSLENSTLHSLIDEQDRVHLPATYMSQTYFDEIYFVRTAEQYLNRQWPYEWTHPPLGKLIQAAGITVFGFSPFGWRIMGVIFATLMIPVMYLLGKRLFGSWIGAFSSAFLLTFDFMHFTMGRMGTADTYVVFFALLSQFSFLVYFTNVIKNGWKTSVIPLFLAVLFFILGFSTKWLVFYGALGMLFLLFALRIKDVSKLKEGIGRKYAAFFDYPFILLLGFIALAVGIYFVVYIPDMIIGRTLEGVFKLQFDMYNYHSTLVATHSFSSAWWSWPFLVSPSGYVPLWLWVTDISSTVKSTIVVLGNPAVWWVGFACVVLVVERAVHGKESVLRFWKFLTKKALRFWRILTKKQTMTESSIASTSGSENSVRRWDLPAVFIATLFLFSWVPYVLISRITFLYHFYVSVPFLCLASAYFINMYWNTKKGKAATIVFFVAVVVLFVVFYPVISGVPEAKSWIDSLKLFPSWFF